MDTPTTKDYIDARLETVKGEVNVKLAQSEAQLQKLSSEIAKSQNEIIKWVVGALFTSSALTISTVSFLLSQTPPRSSAPIVIYAQPPAAATPPPAPGR